MEPRIHYVIVGLFVLLLGTATVGLSLWLAFGERAYEYRTYRIYMTESVSGLFIDAPVKYRGVQVGHVRALSLVPDNPEQVQVTVDIDAGVKIKEDTLATLVVQGVTGIASIELSGGSRESPELATRAGEPYPVIKPGQSLFTRVDSAVSELVGNLNKVTHDLHLLLTPQARENFANIIQNVNDLTTTVAGRRAALGEGIDAFAEFSRNTATASAQLPGLMARLDTAISSLQNMSDEIAMTTRELRTQVHAGGDSLQSLGGRTLPEVEALLGEMRQLTVSFQRLSDRLEEDPRALLYGPQLEAPGPGE